MDGFVDRLKSAVAVSEAFYTQIARHPKATVERIPNGTNLTRVVIKGVDPLAIRKRLTAQGVYLPNPAAGGVFTLGVNETWNRTTAADLGRQVTDALGG